MLLPCLIELKDVSLAFKNNVILKNVLLSLNENEINIITGPSGSWKTTLLKAIWWIKSVKSGHYFFKWKNIKDDKNSVLKNRSKHFWYFFTDSSFFENLSAKENILSLWVFSDIVIDIEYMNYLAEYFEIEDLLELPINKLSSWQRERIWIIRTFVHKPKIILFDEPWSHLDDRLFKKMMDFIVDYKSNNKAHLSIVSHNEKFYNISNHIYKIYDSEVHILKDSI